MDFGYKTKEEVEKLILDYWSGCEYLEKIRILLAAYEKLNITKIEALGVNSLWRKLGLEKQKDIYSQAHRYQI